MFSKKSLTSDQYNIKKFKLKWLNENLEQYDTATTMLENEPVGAYCPLDQKLTVPQVPVGTCYTLSKEEALLCIRVGKRRERNNSLKSKYVRQRFADQTQMDVQGVIGEYAFCRLFGLPIEIFDCTTRNVDNDTFDATMPNGWKVDVKTTARLDLQLLVSMNKARNPPTLYALMVYKNLFPHFTDEEQVDKQLPTVEFKGFIHYTNILKTNNIKKLGRTNMLKYAASQERLVCFEDIPSTVNANHLFMIM